MRPDAVAYYLESLRNGDVEDARCGLLDEGLGALPLVIVEASKAENRTFRRDLVHIIWQFRHPQAIGFLGQALLDPDAAVWKEALDGLVAIGGPQAIDCIRETKTFVDTGAIRNGLTADWLDEALEQLSPPRDT